MASVVDRSTSLKRRLSDPASELRLTLLRMLFSGALSALIDLLVWSTRSTHLSGHLDVIGKPTFTDFDISPTFLKYRLITYAFPAGVILSYALLTRRGPLKSRAPAARDVPVPLLPMQSTQVSADDDTGALQSVALWRVIAPAVFVGFVAALGSGRLHAKLGLPSVVAACAYAAIVLALSWIASRLRLERGPAYLRPPRDRAAIIAGAAGSVAAIGGLWFVARHTEVMLPHGHLRRWSWLPLWLAVVGILAAWAWGIDQLRRGRSPQVTERRLRVVLLGSAAMYLVVAVIPPELNWFQGFDDGQSVAGASLLLHGYFPWRDFQFIHGIYPDVLDALLGFHIFGRTAWGVDAGNALILVPLSWIGVYLLAVWGSRRGSLVVLAPLAFAASAASAVAVASGAFGLVPIDPRFIAVAFVLLLLGKSLSTPRLAWTVLLTTVLFIEAVSTPDADVQVPAVLVVILASDLVHRQAGQTIFAALRRTRCFVATGAALLIVWVAFLASQHALKGYINWFIIFVPDHVLEGAGPPNGVGPFQSFMFRLMVALVILTVLSAAWRVHRRRPWTPLHWVTLAAALSAGVYGEQAVARYDDPHVAYSLDVGLPLFVLVAAAAAPRVEHFARALVSRLSKGRGWGRYITQPVTVVGLIATILLVPAAHRTLGDAAQRTRTQVKKQGPPTGLGYSAPGLPGGPGVLSDLRKVLATYEPKNAPFFDMTNAPGYFYFLLAQHPASSFTNLSQAITPKTQQMLIHDLEKTRPPLISFSAPQTLGWTLFDNVPNEVRDYDVSRYVLTGWTPLLATHGVLFLLRNDLVAKRPAVPHLTQPAQTTGLYNSQAECTWGYSANFLESPPKGSSLTLRSHTSSQARRVTVVGWDYDPVVRKPAKELVVLAGHRVAGIVPLGVDRPDVAQALRTSKAAHSGFNYTFLTKLSGPVTTYALTSDDQLHPMVLPSEGAPIVSRVRMPDGATLRVGAPITAGHLDTKTVSSVRISTFQLPKSTRGAAYQLATFGSKTTIGPATLTLADSLAAQDRADISAKVLPLSGSKLSVRVGSCLQWYGYRRRTLYVMQHGGSQISSLTLSGVKQ
jgi:hypothetical protein